MVANCSTLVYIYSIVPQSGVQVGGEFVLGRGTSPVNVLQCLMVLQHDPKLSPVTRTQVGQHAHVLQVTSASLVLHESLMHHNILGEVNFR